jgi:hypothetical protein
MAEYFADLCEQGSSYHNATYVLFGFLMLRADDPRPDKQLMSYSRAALKGWSSRYPQASRTGAVPAIWQLIAMHMSEESPPLAAAVMIQACQETVPILGCSRWEFSAKPGDKNRNAG